MRSPEVMTMGRVGVDLYPEQIGVTLAEVRTFAKSLGGSPTNVAVAAARFGRRAAVITKGGDVGYGGYVYSVRSGSVGSTGWRSAYHTYLTPPCHRSRSS